MKLVKRTLLCLLALLMCLACLASCGGDDTTTTTTTTTGNGDPGTPPVQDPQDFLENLLENKTYDGKTCTVWYKRDGPNSPVKCFYVESPGVSSVERAAYNRLQTIKEKTGITIVGVASTASDTSSAGTPDIGLLRDLFAADSPENIPDIVMPTGYAASILAGEGCFLNLGANNPYIDLSRDCWQANINDALSICGTYYSVSGMYSVSNTAHATVIYFDKTALDTIDPTNLEGTAAQGFEDQNTLYEWARNGEWTYPKMLALSAAFAGEEGNVAVPGQDSDTDTYGFEYQGTSAYTLFAATGKKYAAANPDNYGIPAILVDEPETVKVLNWLVDNVRAKPYVHEWGGSNGMTGKVYFGLSNACLFKTDLVRTMTTYSSMGAATAGAVGTFDFGILPMPKFAYEDAPQASYNNLLCAWYSSLACIPKNCTSTDFSSFVLQLVTEMGYTAVDEDTTTIWDAYVTEGLQGRYAPDVEDEEMLDLIFATTSADMGEFNIWSGVQLANNVRDLYRAQSKTWGSYVQGVRTQIDTAILDMVVEMGLVTFG